MDRVCIYIAYNGKWTTDNKYLYHEIKLILVNDGITFEDLVEKIFQVLKLKRGEVQPTIWFDTNLETSKGMLVTNDEEVTTCIYLLKNDPNFKTSRFIVDIAERNSLSARYLKTEEVNIVQHEEMQIDRDETLIPVEPITEFESLATKEKSVETVQSTHGMRLRKRSLPRKVIKKRKRSRSKRNDLPSVVLRGNASLDEIAVGSLFENKESLKKCFTNSAIKYHFKFKTVRSTKKRYYLKCYDDNCSWYLHASRVRDSALFKISKYVEDHSCSADVLQPDQQRHATSRVISDYIRELLPEYETEMTPNFVKEEMRKRFGLNISYHKAWRSIQLAFGVTKGSPEQNNELLPSESEQNTELLMSEPYKELLPSEPEQNNELLMSEPEQNSELLLSEPEQNDLLMSEPERYNELLPSEPEQNSELLLSEPEQKIELFPSELEQNNELLASVPEQNNESEPVQNNALLPSEPLQNNELLPSESEQNTELLMSEPYKELLPSEPEQNNELLMSEPEQKNDLLPSEPEQNNNLLMSEPERNNELVPSEPEQNSELLMSEPEQNSELLMSEPELKIELLPSEPEQKNDSLMSKLEQNDLLMSEPERCNELLPSEPEQNSELLLSEPEQKIELLPSELEQNNELLASIPEQNNELLPSEPEQNNALLLSEPLQNNELLLSEALQNNEFIPSEERNPGRDDQAVLA